ncbi:MAG: type I methionyl aminopeptidase [Coriobacteriia bacterium]|jgi:methionyl aminopeptidase|nr:type I methionyl aminopeptidase [Coriobacteriia bacterium]MDR2714478.1 type I methionyl aminopeptidase [Coriobacteriales bacterium]
MIRLKKPAEIDAMNEAGRVSAKALRKTGELVRPGISTLELNKFAENLIRMEGGIPAFLGYGGFTGSICSSINDQIVHGIPSSDAILQEGDIISIDTGAIVGGWVGDNAATFAVGAISPDAQRLLDVTEESLWAGIEALQVGGTLGDIGAAIQEVAEAADFGVVREYVGHGIGRAMHESPSVPNFGTRGKGPKLKAGLVIAIEPMINAGDYATKGPFEDRWTVFTADGSLSAHFEHTVALTSEGIVILTKE